VFTAPISSIRVVNDWIDRNTESVLVRNVARGEGRAVKLTGRSTQAYGGTVTSDGLADQEALPQWLQALSDRLVAQGVYPPSHTPNHVLINDYISPESGIFPHKDGAAYWPRVSILSLSSSAVMDFHRPRSGMSTSGECGDRPSTETVVCRVFLPPRSLLIFDGAAYTDYLHGICAVAADVIDESVLNTDPHTHGTSVARSESGRISLTIRHVPPATAKAHQLDG